MSKSLLKRAASLPRLPRLVEPVANLQIPVQSSIPPPSLAPRYNAPKTNYEQGVRTRHNSQPDHKAKLRPSTGNSVIVGDLMTFGSNDTWQLGLKCSKSSYPRKVNIPNNRKVKAVSCGGMHTVVLLENGQVWTFGNNDENVLGRPGKEEEELRNPAKVEIWKEIVQISAGDSHSAALATDGTVYCWGIFKNNEGAMGLPPGGGPRRDAPQTLVFDTKEKVFIVKIQSGFNHLAMLSEDGVLFTCGCNDLGQLGRVFRALRSVGNQKDFSLRPTEVRVPKKVKFIDVWSGGSSTFCKSEKDGAIWAFGLNSHGQLGMLSRVEPNIVAIPKKIPSLQGKIWKEFGIGAFHVIAMDIEGRVYSFGRVDDGRLGFLYINEYGRQKDCPKPKLIPALSGNRFLQVACGDHVSYAVREDGVIFAWGVGDLWQMGNGKDEDCLAPIPCRGGKEKEKLDGKVVFVSGGGQHSALIMVKPKWVFGLISEMDRLQI